MKKILCITVLMLIIGFLRDTVVYANSSKNYRLPRKVIPELYALDVYISQRELQVHFSGDVRIVVRCVENTRRVILNVVNMDIEKTDVSISPLPKILLHPLIIVKKIFIEKEKDRLHILLSNSLEAEKKYEISIHFVKQFTFLSVGYYADFYKNEEGIRAEWMVMTKFGEASARHFFPCFDDIDLKANFKITLFHPDSVTGFSNMSSADSKPYAGRESWKMEEFFETPAISTFSVAIALANFKTNESVELPSNKRIRIWADETIVVQLGRAKEIARRMVEFFTNIFGVEYGLSKLDILALPNYDDEDKQKYGLIAINESSLLPQNLSNKIENIDIAFNFCHVMCHQWIGSNVTPSHWSEYWLYEGITFFYESSCITEVYQFPQQKSNIFNERIVTTFSLLLAGDAEVTTQPVRDLRDNSNGILISKSSLLAKKAYHLVRMMNFFLGVEVFQKSVARFLRAFQFQSPNIDQVWNIFTSEARAAQAIPTRLTVKQIMDSWSNKKGYPILTVRRDYTTNLMHIKQERFRLLEEKEDRDVYLDPWVIPLSFTTKRGIRLFEIEVNYWHQTHLFMRSLAPLRVQNNDWILVSRRLDVPCRVNYDDRNWTLLQQTLLNQNEYWRIDVTTRVRLVSDMFELSKAGLHPYPKLFKAIEYLSHEEMNLPIMVALIELDHIRYGLLGSDIFKAFQRTVAKLLKPIFQRPKNVKINEILETDQFKKLIIQTSCTFGIHECQIQCLELFNQLKLQDRPEESDIISIEIRGIVYCTAVMYGDESQWNFLWSMYERATEPSEKTDILWALGCSRDKIILKNYLKLMISSPKISPDDCLTAFVGLSSNEVGYPLMKKFFMKHWAKISEVNVNPYLATLYELTMKQADLNELNEFMRSIKDQIDDSDTKLKESIRKATKNVLWRRKHIKILTEFFS